MHIPSRDARRRRSAQRRQRIAPTALAWFEKHTVKKQLPTGRTLILSWPNRAQRRAEVARQRRLVGKARTRYYERRNQLRGA